MATSVRTQPFPADLPPLFDDPNYDQTSTAETLDYSSAKELMFGTDSAYELYLSRKCYYDAMVQLLSEDRLHRERYAAGILDFFNSEGELARDDRTWFKTLIGINCGVITALISKCSGNYPKSLPTEIMESFTACCAVIGIFATLAGLYLTTNMPKSLPFGCDPEVSTQLMGIVGGLASACGFTAGVLLLLPNNLFRGITMGVAFAAFMVPIFIELHPFSRPHPDGLLPEADTNVPFSEADADVADSA